jgi:hypothetical protein
VLLAVSMVLIPVTVGFGGVAVPARVTIDVNVALHTTKAEHDAR